MQWLQEKLNTFANYIFVSNQTPHLPASGKPLKIVAHRGAHAESQTIENTMPAFEACMGSDMIWGLEMDIRLTADMEPVIHHDPACGRLFNRPDIVIAETNFADLRKAVPEIPLLSEIIARFSPRFNLMIELKEDPATKPGMTERFQTLLSPLNPVENFYLLSLVPHYLDHFNQIPKSAFLDVALFNVPEIIKANLRLGHGGIAGPFALFTKNRIQTLREADRTIGTGFLETRGAFNREVNRNIDWLFSNYPLRMASFARHSTQHT